MLFLTAASIGICAGLMRSALSAAFIAFLIVATFAAASVVSAGSPPYFSLLAAILGYNSGLIGFMVGLLAARRYGSV